MKKLFGAIFLLSLLAPAEGRGGCSDAETSGFNCYRYALRGIRESTLPAVLKYAEKARQAAEKALDSAEECMCYGAEGAFRSAYLASRDAVKATTVDESKRRLQNVLRAAEAGTEAAENCR